MMLNKINQMNQMSARDHEVDQEWNFADEKAANEAYSGNQMESMPQSYMMTPDQQISLGMLEAQLAMQNEQSDLSQVKDPLNELKRQIDFVSHGQPIESGALSEMEELENHAEVLGMVDLDRELAEDLPGEDEQPGDG